MTQRFVPTRAGIVNLYEYADQTFDFADGRLLLRGHNTSGKTKVLELLFPFVLDGDISPSRLDPFAGTAKEMKWNLVGCIENENRVGYVWLELERPDRHGGVERVTVGIGMKASRDRPGVVRWYWLLHDRRVGEEFPLVRPDREPFSRAEFAAALGDDGELLGTPSEYRERLRERVFGLATADEYRVMLELMRQLRRPHLSKSLDPGAVAEMLAAGLPSVDDALLRRLAGGLEQLEALEAGLQRVRANRGRLQSFHERTYRAYAQALVRERGQALRSADTEARAAAEALRDATARETELARDEARLRAELDGLRSRATVLEGEERALVTSAAWASIAEVAQLGERVRAELAAAAERRAAAEEARAEALAGEAELITATAAVADARAGADERLDEIDRTATTAGLGARASSLREQLAAALLPMAWREELRALALGAKAVLVRQGELRRAVRAAEAAAGRARAALRTAEERLADARALREETEGQVEQARDARDAAVLAWSEELRELELAEDELTAVRAAAGAGEAVEPLLAPGVGRARDGLAAERAAADAELAEHARERSALEAEATRLRAAHDEPPAAPGWRRSSREGRAGAPLWRAVELRDRVTASQAAGLEAALHAAGLLDAWLTPDGSLLDAETDDVVLAAGGRAGSGAALDAEPGSGAALQDSGATLGSVLRADAASSVPASIVDAVLGAITYAPSVTHPCDAGPAAVIGADGSFVLGPLRGRASKPAAEHLGAGARAARRARRLAEITTALEALAVAAAAIQDRLTALAERGAVLAAELAGFPSAAPLDAALRSLGVATTVEGRARGEHEQAAAEASRHASALVAAEAGQREHAAEHGLEPELDDDALGARREACSELLGAVAGVARELDALALAGETLASRSERQHVLTERVAARERRAAEGEEHAARLAAEHAERESALGAEGAQLRERHQAVSAELLTVRRARAQTTADLETAHDAAREAARDVREAAAGRDATRGAREGALDGVRALARGALLAAALGDDAPEDAAAAPSWPLTRALEVARALPERVTRVSVASGELAQRVTRSVMDLGQELAEADLGVYTESHDGLVLVHVTEGPSDRTLDEVLRNLALDVAERERLLTTEERRVFGATLVEELADHLRVRMRRVGDRVGRMNAILRRCPTASGKTIQLEWRVKDDDGLRPMVELLRRAVSSAKPEDRDRLVEFFRARISAAREGLDAARGEAMVETLAAAFDYRSWHGFELWQEQAGARERLTRKRHAVGSGGEQAVLIHLPLFAAAAALYDDTPAPRLIMLDEALSGIDDETRQRVLGATVAFDLDLVMTSHELWGTYVTVPALSIYQLHRHNGEPGVHAIPFRWDGDVLSELEQGELLVA